MSTPIPIMNQPVDDPSENISQPSEAGDTELIPCVYCYHMDFELMVCGVADVWDLACTIPNSAGSAGLNPPIGYLHHPTYQSLEECTCKVCKAMVIEIERYLTNDITASWKSRLSFIASQLSSIYSQIYLHFPISRGCGGREITISCWSGLFDLEGQPQDLDKIGWPRNPSYERPTDPDEVEWEASMRPRAFVIGKIGMYFFGQTEPEHGVAKQQDAALLEGKAKKFRIRNLPQGWNIADDPLSDPAIATVTYWMSHCAETHDLCKPKGDVLIMPTRLIDVGSQEPLQHPRLLCTTEGEVYAYTALSHSWGGRVALKTRRDTLEERKKEIPLENFPRTFRDAVLFTRKLGFQYLWIDSLCIIQGDDEDWLKEGEKMGDIYRNSALTLSATTAKDSTEGFLHPRPRRFEPMYLKYPSRNPCLNGILAIRPSLMSWTKCVEGDQSPLSSRAWILQERLLPPRTLHFGHEQMFWECRTGLTEEAQDYEPINALDDLYLDLGQEWELNKVFLFPEGSEERIEFITSRDRYRSLKQIQRRRQDELADPDVNEGKRTPDHHRIWFDIVQNYSSRKLSYQSDKLLAVSGAARQMQGLLGKDRYVAGLWESQLHRGLAWQTKTSRTRQKDYQAPSWSWASMISIVSFPHDSEIKEETWNFTDMEDALPEDLKWGCLKEKAKLHDIQIVLRNPHDPYGQVLEGSCLELFGLWIRIGIEFQEATTTYVSYETDPVLHSTWTRSVLPGVVISDDSFNLAFVHDNDDPTCYSTEDGSLYFPGYTTVSPHDNNMFTGNAMRFSLDEHFVPNTFQSDGSFYIFELQHLVDKIFLMVEKVRGEDSYRRIGIAVVIQLQGNKLGLLDYLSERRKIKII